MPSLEDAIILAATAHRGQCDKAGQPYILHPLTMMIRLRTADERLVAVLHDVVEDSDTTLDDLRRLGYDEPIVQAVDHLTRRETESYEEFIARAAADPVARAVKIADLEHNLDTARLGEITERDQARLARYQRALDYLGGLADGG